MKLPVLSSAPPVPSHRSQLKTKLQNLTFMVPCIVNVFLTQYCAVGKIEKNEMGGACGAYGGGERGAQGFDGEA